ncbi:MAG TPA: cytochrome C assembly protein [Chloroflexi bacterium]|nr:cytochrome C assembly protein [Chloroflexota bacterium]|tara:strand:+ start:5693 stop:6409 length:717 start_codon:yes stop_codon:yes gene_type:complete
MIMTSYLKQNNKLAYMTVCSFLLITISGYMTLIYAPQEIIMGDVQRLFYYHVASGWIGALAFFITLIASILFLITKHEKYDLIAMSSAEIGVVFISMNIISGSIWARPVWNTWWTWDPRLTTATIMWLLYIAYLFLHTGLENHHRRAHITSVYGIVAFVSVPLTFAAIRIWRTIHPVVIGSSDPNAEGQFDMTSKMTTTLLFTVATFTILYCTLIWHRIRIQQMQISLSKIYSHQIGN